MSNSVHTADEAGSHDAHAHGEGKWQLALALLSGTLLIAGWIAGRTMDDKEALKSKRFRTWRPPSWR